MLNTQTKEESWIRSEYLKDIFISFSDISDDKDNNK